MYSNFKLLSYFKNNDVKVLIENFVSLSFLQIAGYIFPLFTIPYLARVIGLEKFGEIAFASVIIVYFQTVTDWGFSYTATRDIAKNRDDINKISEIYSNVIWSKIILILVSLLTLALLIIIVPKFREMYILLLVTFCIMPGYVMFPEWLFQGLERMKYITVLNLLSKFIFTITIFLFIKEKSDFILQPLFTSLGFLVSGVISLFIIRFKLEVKLKRPVWSEIKTTLISSKDVFLNQLLPNLYNSFSTLLLGFFCGNYAIGILDAGGKFISIAQQFTSIISRTFFPFLSRRIDKHYFFAKISILFSIFLSIVLFAFAPLIIHLFFTSEFNNSIIVLRILSFSIISLTLCNVYGTNFLIIMGYEHTLKKITFVISIIGFFISIPLVYYYNFIGAALSVSITRCLLGVSILFKALKLN